MKINHTEHIVIFQDSIGEIYIDVDDYELMDQIDDYLSVNGIRYEAHQDQGDKYRMYFGDSYSFEHIKNIILKFPIQEIEEIYKLGNPEEVPWEPGEYKTTFRDVLGIIMLLLGMVCSGGVGYLLSRFLFPDLAIVTAFFSGMYFIQSQIGETFIETLIVFIILTGIVWLALTFIPYFESIHSSLIRLLTSAISGLIVGWSANKLIFLVANQMHGKDDIDTEET